MSILSGTSEFFGLDVGTTALRVVQLKGVGPVKTLYKYGQLATGGTITLSDAPADRQKITQLLGELIKQSGIVTKNVAVNIPSNRVFTTLIDLDRLPPSELGKTINYQAESFIPTPIAKSKIDWALVGDSPQDPKKIEVLLSSVPTEVVEVRMDMLEATGLNVIAIEPDSIALARSLIPDDATGSQMVLDIGATITDLLIAMGGVPRLSRAIPTGTQTLIRTASQHLSIDGSQAEQFVFKFGLGQDKLEGRVYKAIIDVVDGLMNEVEKSIEFFQERYPSSRLERILVTGGASTLPELPVYIANKTGITVEIGNAWRNVSIPPDRQNELAAVSNHFAVAAGLAQRHE